MKRLLPALLLFTIAAPAFAQPAEDAQDREVELVREVLRVTRTAETMEQIVPQMLLPFRQMNPEVPAELWDRLIAEMDMSGLIEAIIPIYTANFTEADLEGMIAFYESPVGKKMIERMPVLMQESILVGQQWGQDVARRVLEQIQTQGFTIKT